MTSKLPDYMLITGQFTNSSHFLAKLKYVIRRSNIKLVQLRIKEISHVLYQKIAAEVLTICHQHNAVLICNSDLASAIALQADGIHLTSQRLYEYQKRPCSNDMLLSAACHNHRDIKQANRIQADCITLSPVFVPSYKQSAKTLGWKNFQVLTQIATCPVFALGGLIKNDIFLAKQFGAHGIAGIACFWNDN